MSPELSYADQIAYADERLSAYPDGDLGGDEALGEILPTTTTGWLVWLVPGLIGAALGGIAGYAIAAAQS